MRNIIHKTFVAHPESVDETYFEHFRFALGFAGTLFVAAFAAFIHALVPCAYERTASEKINALHSRMHNR